MHARPLQSMPVCETIRGSRMKDYVFPNNNESEFIIKARALNIRELCFVYPFPGIKNVPEIKGVSITTATIATSNQLKSGNIDTKQCIVHSDASNDRWLIEKIKPMLMFGFEFQERHDFMHHRNSALNHITAKLMAKNNIIYGFPVAALIHAPQQMQGIILGRFRQNMQMCKKYKVTVVLASFATDPWDMRNLKDMKGLVE